MELVSIVWAVSIVVGALIGWSKGQLAGGAVLAFLFGPLGVLGALFLDSLQECPACRGRVKRGALICQHCHQPLRRSSAVGRQPGNARQVDHFQPAEPHGVEDQAADWVRGESAIPAPPPPPPRR